MDQAIPVPRVRKYQLPEGTHPTQEFDMHPPQDPTPSNPYLNPVMLGQDHLEKIFHAALADLGCAVELGTELVSFTQSDDHVEAKLLVKGMDPNAEGVEEVASFEYMVGADGARGVVRKQLGLAFIGETREIENFVVGDIRVEGLSDKYWHIWGDATSIMLSLRGTEEPNLFNFVIAGKNINHADLANDEIQLRKVFAESTGNREDLKFGECPWISYYTPNIRIVDKFGIDRVLIVGDSAHVHSPTGGQGMNTGIQDSFNLAWKLALVIKKFAPPSLLDTYTEERHPVVTEMLNQTTKILNTTFKEGEEQPWDANSSLLQLGVNYRWSSIVFDERQIMEAWHKADEDEFMAEYERTTDINVQDYDIDELDSYGNLLDGRLCAGDRAPDASGLVDRSVSSLFRTTYDLFRIFGSHYHTVLIFSELADPQPVLKLLKIYPPGTVRSVIVTPRGRSIPDPVAASADLVLEDGDGHAYCAYIPGKTCGIVAVRPDGIIGAIIADRRRLHKYFLAIFAGETRKVKTNPPVAPH
ncbi:pentachlorophenol 4-monooxygenase [Macrolepiota fuliginosa MF-IS2]|uniref:Pentachlorophenol 4-monooxygenase n=1 Tax=Macrolepiota fuliginosa MF-IS2 TaxID=1400762 RepID=A0A9P5XN21_9AGAR|nr:pentachlorophenol 4-monooxygenase [Macrolepiota fuliginosa MF-IS2]